MYTYCTHHKAHLMCIQCSSAPSTISAAAEQRQDVEMTYARPLPPNPNSAHCPTNWGPPTNLAQVQIPCSQIRRESKSRGFAEIGGLQRKGLKREGLAGPGLARTLIDLSSYKGGLCGLTVGRRDWEFFSEGFLLPKVMINALLVVLVVPL